MNLFKTLSIEEESDFRKWARDNYKVGGEIKSVWHPVIIHEIGLMTLEEYNKQK